MSLRSTADTDRKDVRRPSRAILVLAALQALLLSACAQAGPSGQPSLTVASRPAEFGHLGGYQPILAELPQDAPPGDCYAHVIVPGQPMLAPPQAQGAAWVLNPGPPGSPGPIWCLVPTGVGPAQVVMSPDRDGWIRVLCDVDATAARIEGWQRRLSRDGYYHGAQNGRYDPATADAVGRFQRERHIDHGGYLSMDTVKALEGPPGPPPRQGYVAAAPVYSPPPAQHARPEVGRAAGPAQSQAYAAAAAAGVGYAPYPAVAQQPAYGYPAYPSYPAYPQAYPAAPQTYAYPQAGYVQQGYAAQYGASASYQGQASYAAASYSGYGVATSQAYGYGQSYAYGQAQAYPGYGYPPGPRPAYAAGRSAIQDGWLTWAGKSSF